MKADLNPSRGFFWFYPCSYGTCAGLRLVNNTPATVKFNEVEAFRVGGGGLVGFACGSMQQTRYVTAAAAAATRSLRWQNVND